MQNVSFRTVGEVFDFIPEDQLLIAEQLREIILSTIPDVREHLAYNVPYYNRFANICFVWPGAISWGSKTNKGVRLGFTRGYLMTDPLGFLDRGGRKQVYWHDFFDHREVDETILIDYLTEAAMLDEQARRH